MKNIYYILLSLLSGILLSIGWPSHGFPLILFISFIPLLFIEQSLCNEQQTTNNGKRIKPGLQVFMYSYLSFFVWNLLTTWWIYNSTAFGAAFAIFFNTLFMAIVFWLFHLTKRKLGKIIGYTSLVVYWIAFEYLHLNWELSWSWLNLGNGFANYPILIQWYEFTGTLGGTCWILLLNVIFFLNIELLIRSKFTSFSDDHILSDKSDKSSYLIISALSLFIIPIIISCILYERVQEPEQKINVVIVQPNIDPYNEKFGGIPLSEQLSKMLNLAKSKVNDKTDLLVFPETAISDGVWENRLNEEPRVKVIESFIKNYPHLKIIIGMSSFRAYTPGDWKSSTARKFTDENAWYDAYNTAMLIYLSDTSDYKYNIQLYHKSKLVPGVERMPYPNLLGFLNRYSINLGGMTGSLGTQKDRTPFKIKRLSDYQIKSDKSDKSDDLIIAPSICYESVYGEFMSEYIRNGANLICIITNDGWWKDSPGYKQHFQYARLRAIETRRCIVRSANTGISGFIDEKGNILMRTQWWKPLAIEREIGLNKRLTFYVKFGDYFGKISLFLSAFILLSLYKSTFTLTLNTNHKSPNTKH